MPITSEFVSEAGSALLLNTPLAAQNEQAMTAIKSKILSYEQTLGRTPSVDLVVSWAREPERELQAAVDAAAAADQAERERTAVREKQRSEYLAPADRSEAVREFNERNATLESVRKPYTPKRSFTDAELEAMDSDTYAREQFGVEKFKQGTTGYVLKPEKPSRHVKKLKVSDVEIASRESRQRDIDADRGARKLALQDLRKAEEARKAGKKK